MADYRTTQPTFTGGEVSRDLYGRKDLARYQTSAKRMENILIHAAGGASNRNGLKYLGPAGVGDKFKLTRFEAAGDDAFLLVWGNNSLKFAANGGYVISAGSPYVLETVFSSSNLRDIYMDQAADVATITHPEFAVQELRRYDATDWRFSYVGWSPDLPPPTGVAVATTQSYIPDDSGQKVNKYEYKVSSVTTEGVESLPSAVVLSGDVLFGYSQNYNTITWDGGSSGSSRVGSGPSGSSNNFGTIVDLSYELPHNQIVTDIEVYIPASLNGVVGYIVKNTAGVISVERRFEMTHRGGGWQRTAIGGGFTVPATGSYHVAFYCPKKTSGIVLSQNVTPTLPSRAGLRADGQISGTVSTMTSINYTFATGAYYGDASDDLVIIEEYIVYKGKNGVFGSIGRTPNLTFKDDNIAPDFTNGPQDGYSPFDNGNFPAINYYAEQRRGFARSNKQPATNWMTQSADFDNMRSHTPTQDSDAIEFTLAATKKQDIFHVLAKKQGLLVFTRSGEWVVTGRDGDILTPSSIQPNPQSYYGSAQYIRPIIIGNSIIFVQRDYQSVLEMEYSFEVDSYKADDKTLLAKHLFENKKIVAWDYAKRPHDVIWCAMDDGSALTLTYMKDQDVWGWSRHNTSGKFCDVVVIPETNGDVPYFLIERINTNGMVKNIEFLPPRRVDDIRDATFMDSYLSYDVPLTYAGISYSDQAQIAYSGSGIVDGDEIEIAGSSIHDIDGNLVLSFDGRYQVERDTVNPSFWSLIHKTNSETWNEGDYLDLSSVNDWGRPINSMGLVLGVMRKCISQITEGLDHLEGRVVTALCDGNVYDRTYGGNLLIVENGGLPAFDDFSGAKFARIHVGLPYRSVLQTLDFLNTQADDNGVEKTIGSVYVRLDKTRGIKFAVDNEAELFEAIPPREAESYYDPPELLGGLYEVQGSSGWDKEKSLIFVQDYPLPMTILGVTNDAYYGDP